jgi:hypothetical protein
MAKTYATCMLATETASDSTVRVKLTATGWEEEGESRSSVRESKKSMWPGKWDLFRDYGKFDEMSQIQGSGRIAS